jgi:membrane protease subunit (stomatin/prohibitin family)
MNMSIFRKNVITVALYVAIAFVGAITFSAPVHADGAGAFLGGIAVARIGQNVRDRNDYEEDQAYYAQQQAQTAQQQANSSRGTSATDKLAQLDTMLKNGYITQAEYNAKKKEILDNM